MRTARRSPHEPTLVIVAIALRKPRDPALWLAAHAGEDVHEMSGPDFEDLLAAAFQLLGVDLIELTEYFDKGADLIVTRGDCRTSVQAKRWTGRVGSDAVEQASRGMVLYGCTDALVITNSIFHPDAQQVASARGVKLWDHRDLANLLQTTGVGTRHRSSAPTCPHCHCPMEYKNKHGAFWGCPNYYRGGCTETSPYHKWDLRVAHNKPRDQAGRKPGTISGQRRVASGNEDRWTTRTIRPSSRASEKVNRWPEEFL